MEAIRNSKESFVRPKQLIWYGGTYIQTVIGKNVEQQKCQIDIFSFFCDQGKRIRKNITIRYFWCKIKKRKKCRTLNFKRKKCRTQNLKGKNVECFCCRATL